MPIAMGSELGVEVFTTKRAAPLAGLEQLTLNKWIALGVLTTSELGAHGRGSRRVLSFRDLVALRVAVLLRDRGVAFPSVLPVVAYLQAREGISAHEALRPTLLVLDGQRFFELDPTDPATTLATLLRSDGAPCTVLPLHAVVSVLQQEARRLRHEEPPKGHKNESHLVRRAAARAA